MDALERDYRTKRAEYDRLISLNNPANLPQIQSLNSELSVILHRMLEEVAKIRGSANNLQTYRDDLMRKLLKIQNESSILLKQKDQYETLRALQAYEKTKFDATLFWYLLSLAIFTVIFIIVLLWKGGYKLPTMPTTTSSATTIPALT
jgi:capsule polysaccharide export protein KpsE/RkpR